MPHYVPDTHSLIWCAMNSPRLGPLANAIFNEVDHGAARLLIPAIAVAEVLFTIERRQLPLDLDRLIHQWRANSAIEIVPLIEETILLMRTTTTVPQMHDRLIVCEAMLRKATVITRDQEIMASGLVATVW